MQISVAMCTYNGETYLQRQLESIATQVLLPDELVICDDGSTDATAEIIRAFAASSPFPVRLIRNDHNLGSTKNFEKAIGLCRGELIALCDQDDVWLPEKLGKLSAVLADDPSVGGVFSNAHIINDLAHRRGALLWDEVGFFPKALKGTVECGTLLRHDVVTGATLMVRANLRSLFIPISPIWIHDGWIAWMLVLYSRLAYVAQPLIEYRIHASQQVGLAINSSLRDRLKRARQAGSGPQQLIARQFEELLEFWTKHPGEHYLARLEDFKGKIQHSYMRVRLPRGRYRRAFSIMRNSRGYRQYSLGLLTMAKDLLC
jgi:glycosyltransferase involved in cell wall biosynthesis